MGISLSASNLVSKMLLMSQSPATTTNRRLSWKCTYVPTWQNSIECKWNSESRFILVEDDWWGPSQVECLDKTTLEYWYVTWWASNQLLTLSVKCYSYSWICCVVYTIEPASCISCCVFEIDVQSVSQDNERQGRICTCCHHVKSCISW